MRFADITGHEEVKESLRAMADSGRMPHAIMLAGMSGIGKTRLARAFTQYVHCRNRRNGDSCGECPSCRQHQGFNNPDMHYIYPIVTKPKQSGDKPVSAEFLDIWKQMLAEDPYMRPERWSEMVNASVSSGKDSSRKQPVIYAEEADSLVADASLSPFKEGYKIYLIWQPEKLQPAAANKLLKIIEEPFPDTIFILVSNNDRDVLQTISSRTQVFHLSPIGQEETADWLAAETGMDRARALETARLAEGSLSKALTLAEGAREREEFGEYFREIMRSAYARRLTVLRNVSETMSGFRRDRLCRFCDYCAEMVRENFIHNLGMPQLNLMTGKEMEFSRRFSPFIHHGNVEEMESEFARASMEIARNVNAKMVLFSTFLSLCLLIRTRKPD